MPSNRLLAGILLSVCLYAPGAFCSDIPLPAQVEAFVDHVADLQGQEVLEQHGVMVHVHDLSELDRLQEHLSKDLPGTEEEARILALQRIHDAQATLSAQFSTAWAPRIRAQQLGITSVPAVVIQGHVFHTADLIYAVRSWLSLEKSP